MRDVYVIGVDTTKFDRYLELSVKDLAQQSTAACLKDAGLEENALSIATNFGENRSVKPFI